MIFATPPRPLVQPLLTCVEFIGRLQHFISFHPQHISEVMTNS
jgi:hypothetical protein